MQSRLETCNFLPNSKNRKQASFFTTICNLKEQDRAASYPLPGNEMLLDAVLPYRNHSHNSIQIIIPSRTSTHANHQVSTEDTQNVILPPTPTSNEVKSDIDKMFADPKYFEQCLLTTIATAKALSKSTIWMQVPMCRSSLIESVLQPNGFQLHHTSPSHIHLFLWLLETIECKVPEYATHQVGVGAVVINRRQEILCVRELRKNYRPWKIPGGLAELGEHIDQAVIREVLEETGVPCTFQSVLGVRHTHGLQFGRSDLYFVCRLQPIEEERTSTQDLVTGDEKEVIIPQPIAQPGEIEAAAWIPLHEYKAMIAGDGKDDIGHPMMKCMMELVERDWQMNDIQRTVMGSVVPGRAPSPIYHAPLRRTL